MRDRIEIANAEALFGHGYRAVWVTSEDEGCAGCEVFDKEGGTVPPVCSVMFWDAVGQYFVELPNGELRVVSMLRILAYTSERVGVRLDGLAR